MGILNRWAPPFIMNYASITIARAKDNMDPEEWAREYEEVKRAPQLRADEITDGPKAGMR